MRWPLILMGALCVCGCREPSIAEFNKDNDLYVPCKGSEEFFLKAFGLCTTELCGGRICDTAEIWTCQAFARVSVCHEKVGAKLESRTKSTKQAEAKPVQKCESCESVCAQALQDQQELRMWRRCGVTEDHDSWHECSSQEMNADLLCNPMHGPASELCVGGTRALFEQMRKDGVTWIDCKEGEVCQ